MESAAVGCAVAKEAGHHRPGLFVLGGKRRAGGDWLARADDPVGAQNPQTDIGDVHRAAFSFAVTRRLAIQFGHHEVDLPPLGNEVSVSAVGAGDKIRIRQIGANPGGNGLLADIEMHEPGDFTGRK